LILASRNAASLLLQVPGLFELGQPYVAHGLGADIGAGQFIGALVLQLALMRVRSRRPLPSFLLDSAW